MARVVAAGCRVLDGALSAVKVPGGGLFAQTRSVSQQAAKSGTGQGLKEINKLLTQMERKMAEREAAQNAVAKPAAFNEPLKPVDPHNPHSKEVVRDSAWEKMFY